MIMTFHPASETTVGSIFFVKNKKIARRRAAVGTFRLPAMHFGQLPVPFRRREHSPSTVSLRGGERSAAFPLRLCRAMPFRAANRLKAALHCGRLQLPQAAPCLLRVVKEPYPLLSAQTISCPPSPEGRGQSVQRGKSSRRVVQQGESFSCRTHQSCCPGA